MMTPAGAALRPALRFFALAFAFALVVWALALVAPRLELGPRAAFALAFGAVVLEILVLAACAPTWAARQAALALVASAALVAALAGASASAENAALLTLALGAGATVLGAALGQRVERPGQLVAVALVSSIADLWSVFDAAGPSARAAAQALSEPTRLALFALPFPLLGTTFVPPLIGAGDALFAALYVAAFRAHGLALGRVLAALAVGFAAGLVALLWSARPLPLLPLLGAAVVACDPAAHRMPARDWRAVLLLSAVLLSAAALRFLR